MPYGHAVASGNTQTILKIFCHLWPCFSLELWPCVRSADSLWICMDHTSWSQFSKVSVQNFTVCDMSSWCFCAQFGPSCWFCIPVVCVAGKMLLILLSKLGSSTCFHAENSSTDHLHHFCISLLRALVDVRQLPHSGNRVARTTVGHKPLRAWQQLVSRTHTGQHQESRPYSIRSGCCYKYLELKGLERDVGQSMLCPYYNSTCWIAQKNVISIISRNRNWTCRGVQ